MAGSVMRSFAFAAATFTALTAAAPTAAAQTTFTISEADIASIAAKVGENPDDYSGFYYDGDHYVLTVPERAPARGQALVRSLSASGKQAKVVVQTRPTTYRDLLTIRDKVGAGSLGQVPVVWGVDPRRDLVRVGVRTMTTEVVQAAQRAYGDKVEVFDASSIQPAKGQISSDRPIRFEQFTEAEMAAQAAANRLLDSAPYYAGDRIIAQVGGNTVAWCTSGYHSASRNTIFTAGHCFPRGTVVYQGYFDDSTNTVRYTTVFGNVGEVQWGDNRMDAEVIPNVSNLSYAVWAGPAPNGSGLPFNGRTMAVAGSNVCTDGSVTGERCQAVVTLVDGCQRVDNFNVCGVDAAQAPSGTRVVEHGDSGGPVIRRDNSGGALFTGLISAGNVGNGPGQGPGDYVIFTDSSRACTIAQC